MCGLMILQLSVKCGVTAGTQPNIASAGVVDKLPGSWVSVPPSARALVQSSGESQLWHCHTNGPFAGRISEAAQSLGPCPESTVREGVSPYRGPLAERAPVLSLLLSLFLCLFIPPLFLLFSLLPQCSVSPFFTSSNKQLSSSVAPFAPSSSST